MAEQLQNFRELPVDDPGEDDTIAVMRGDDAVARTRTHDGPTILARLLALDAETVAPLGEKLGADTSLQAQITALQAQVAALAALISPTGGSTIFADGIFEDFFA